jgi:hypothetical protein
LLRGDLQTDRRSETLIASQALHDRFLTLSDGRNGKCLHSVFEG